MFNVEIEEQLYSLTIICLLVILFKCSLHLDKSAALMMLMETVLELGGKTFKVWSSVRWDKDPNARLEKQRVKRSFIAIKFKNTQENRARKTKNQEPGNTEQCGTTLLCSKGETQTINSQQKVDSVGENMRESQVRNNESREVKQLKAQVTKTRKSLTKEHGLAGINWNSRNSNKQSLKLRTDYSLKAGSLWVCQLGNTQRFVCTRDLCKFLFLF